MPWDQDVSGLDAHPDSAAILGALRDAGGWGAPAFQIDMSPVILHAGASTPKHTFTPKDATWAARERGDADLAEFWSPDCDAVPWPVPPGGALEGEPGYACRSDGDCHLLVIDDDARVLYEMWRADLRASTFLAGCAVTWDLTRTWDTTLRGRGCTSADGAGFPITAMLATADEVATGEVHHALRFTLPNDRIRDGVYVPPATHSTFPTSGGALLPPYGVRLRLRSTFDPDRLPAGGARVLARALQRYGMFLADGGNIPLIVASDRGASTTWEAQGVDSHVLDALTPDDFEVVDMGTPVDWNADSDCHRNP